MHHLWYPEDVCTCTMCTDVYQWLLTQSRNTSEFFSSLSRNNSFLKLKWLEKTTTKTTKKIKTFSSVCALKKSWLWIPKHATKEPQIFQAWSYSHEISGSTTIVFKRHWTRPLEQQTLSSTAVFIFKTYIYGSTHERIDKQKTLISKRPPKSQKNILQGEGYLWAEPSTVFNCPNSGR